MINFYITVEREGKAEFKDKGSKFIGYIFPFSKAGELKPIIKNLKKEHKKAVHFCFAYRIGTNGNTFRSSDDGEPSGTAGKSILGQIDSKKVINVLIVVVRYFGGILLGVSGLTSAYKTTASLVLQVIPFIKKPILEEYQLQFDYTLTNDVLKVLKQYKVEIIKMENQLFNNIIIGLTLNKTEEVLQKLKDFRNVEIIKIL